MPSADAEVYDALRRAFEGLSVRWYLFGAQAAIVHGAARFTEDVDVTVDLGSRSTRALVDALRIQDFQLRVTDDSFVEQTRVLPLLHMPTSIPVDVVLAGPGIEDLFFEGATPTDIEGVLVPVARAEDLVVMKILAGRPKDLEDVAAILSARGNDFDQQRSRHLLELLEQALGQSDLLSQFDASLARVAKARR